MKRADKLFGCSEVLLNKTRTAMLANIVQCPDGIALAANDLSAFVERVRREARWAWLRYVERKYLETIFGTSARSAVDLAGQSIATVVAERIRNFPDRKSTRLNSSH